MPEAKQLGEGWVYQQKHLRLKVYEHPSFNNVFSKKGQKIRKELIHKLYDTARKTNKEYPADAMDLDEKSALNVSLPELACVKGISATSYYELRNKMKSAINVAYDEGVWGDGEGGIPTYSRQNILGVHRVTAQILKDRRFKEIVVQEPHLFAELLKSIANDHNPRRSTIRPGYHEPGRKMEYLKLSDHSDHSGHSYRNDYVFDPPLNSSYYDPMFNLDVDKVLGIKDDEKDGARSAQQKNVKSAQAAPSQPPTASHHTQPIKDSNKVAKERSIIDLTQSPSLSDIDAASSNPPKTNLEKRSRRGANLQDARQVKAAKRVARKARKGAPPKSTKKAPKAGAAQPSRPGSKSETWKEELAKLM